jgi:transcriptional regulator with XRE-family HTH domain
MEISLKELGQVIQELRVGKGLTQDDLGTKAGYKAGAGVSISRIENGFTRPGRERFEGIALELGMTPAQLEAAAEERTRDNSGVQAETDGLAKSPVRREHLEDQSKPIIQELERRKTLNSELYGAFNETHDRARDEFFMPFVEIAGRIDGAPQPDAENLNLDDVKDAKDAATFRLRFKSRRVEHVLANAVALNAPTVGSAAAYGAFRLAVSLGTASTGAANSDLFGIAKTNAALAGLGRGTLANGGAGVAGGKRLLTGIQWGTALLLMTAAVVWDARRSLKQQQEQAAALRELDAEIRATRRGLEALEDFLPRATQVLDDIAVHGGRALNKWEAQVGPQPLEWDSLDPSQRKRYQDFAKILGCQLEVTELDFQELMESRGEDRERLIELFDRVLNQSQEVVDSLV